MRTLPIAMLVLLSSCRAAAPIPQPQVPAEERVPEPLVTPGERVVVRGRGVYRILARGPLHHFAPPVTPPARPRLYSVIGRHGAVEPDDAVLLLERVSNPTRGYLPVEASEKWLRAPITLEQSAWVIEALLATLENDPPGGISHERVDLADMDELVQLYRALRTRAGMRALRNNEREIFTRTEWLIIQELAAVRGIGFDEARALLPQAPVLTEACADLARRVSTREASLSSFSRTNCPPIARTWAILQVTGDPESSSFSRAKRSSGGVVSHRFMGARQVRWEGECLAHVDEAIPHEDVLPPAACLSGATIREQDHPGELSLENARAGLLMANEDLQVAWRACRRTDQAEPCLDALLPLEGALVSIPHAHAEKWLEFRDRDPRPPLNDFEGHCRLVLSDEAEGLLAYRCEGSLVEALCNATSIVSFDSLVRERDEQCAPDARALVVVA
jgi:hypothetical protein